MHASTIHGNCMEGPAGGPEWFIDFSHKFLFCYWLPLEHFELVIPGDIPALI